MLACYAETDSLYLECLSADGRRQWASFGTGNDSDDSLEASPDDIREFSGKCSIGFTDVLLWGSLFRPQKTNEPDLRRYINIRIHSN